MRTRNAIIGAAALAALAGCSTPYEPMTIEGTSAYCVRQSAEDVSGMSHIGIYIDVSLEQPVQVNVFGISRVFVSVFGSEITHLFDFEVHYPPDIMGVDYSLKKEDIEIRGFVGSAVIQAKQTGELGQYVRFPLEKVNCGTLDAMLNQ